jgi:transcriptional regulator with XRE-family HTH domain
LENGKRLARAREELGLTDNELGERVGLSGATIYYYQIGLFDPGEHLEAIARETGKPVEWFLDPDSEDDLIGALAVGRRRPGGEEGRDDGGAAGPAAHVEHPAE